MNGVAEAMAEQNLRSNNYDDQVMKTSHETSGSVHSDHSGKSDRSSDEGKDSNGDHKISAREATISYYEQPSTPSDSSGPARSYVERRDSTIKSDIVDDTSLDEVVQNWHHMPGYAHQGLGLMTTGYTGSDDSLGPNTLCDVSPKPSWTSPLPSPSGSIGKDSDHSSGSSSGPIGSPRYNLLKQQRRRAATGATKDSRAREPSPRPHRESPGLSPPSGPVEDKSDCSPDSSSRLINSPRQDLLLQQRQRAASGTSAISQPGQHEPQPPFSQQSPGFYPSPTNSSDAGDAVLEDNLPSQHHEEEASLNGITIENLKLHAKILALEKELKSSKSKHKKKLQAFGFLARANSGPRGTVDRHGRQSAPLFADVPNIIRESTVGVLLHRAHINFLIKDFDEMVNRAQEALSIAEKLDFAPLISRCHFIIGVAYFNSHRYELAQEEFLQSWDSIDKYGISGQSIDDWQARTRAILDNENHRSLDAHAHYKPLRPNLYRTDGFFAWREAAGSLPSEENSTIEGSSFSAEPSCETPSTRGSSPLPVVEGTFVHDDATGFGAVEEAIDPRISEETLQKQKMKNIVNQAFPDQQTFKRLPTTTIGGLNGTAIERGKDNEKDGEYRISKEVLHGQQMIKQDTASGSTHPALDKRSQTRRPLNGRTSRKRDSDESLDSAKPHQPHQKERTTSFTLRTFPFPIKRRRIQSPPAAPPTSSPPSPNFSPPHSPNEIDTTALYGSSMRTNSHANEKDLTRKLKEFFREVDPNKPPIAPRSRAQSLQPQSPFFPRPNLNHSLGRQPGLQQHPKKSLLGQNRPSAVAPWMANSPTKVRSRAATLAELGRKRAQSHLLDTKRVDIAALDISREAIEDDEGGKGKGKKDVEESLVSECDDEMDEEEVFSNFGSKRGLMSPMVFD